MNIPLALGSFAFFTGLVGFISWWRVGPHVCKKPVEDNGLHLETAWILRPVNFSNLGDAPTDLEMAGPSTPAHAQFRQRRNVGALWTFGIKGTF